MNFVAIFSKIENVAKALAATYTLGDSEVMHGTENSHTDTNFWLSKLDEHLHIISHEMVTEIMLRLQTLRQINELLEFKKKYAEFTSQQMEMILTTASETKVLQLLQKENLPATDALVKVKQMKTEWNQLFQNKEYEKIIATLKK